MFLRPRQRVVVFPRNDASGATLGYHGTVVRLVSESLLKQPFLRDSWVYRVYVPYLKRAIDFTARDLLALEEWDEIELPVATDEAEPAGEICLEQICTDDNGEIRGSYRVYEHRDTHFLFQKCDIDVADYQLQLTTTGDDAGSSQLSYRVPFAQRLDWKYLLCALGEITGVRAWHVKR